jgi:hypothetical protein
MRRGPPQLVILGELLFGSVPGIAKGAGVHRLSKPVVEEKLAFGLLCDVRHHVVGHASRNVEGSSARSLHACLRGRIIGGRNSIVRMLHGEPSNLPCHGDPASALGGAPEVLSSQPHDFTRAKCTVGTNEDGDAKPWPVSLGTDLGQPPNVGLRRYVDRIGAIDLNDSSQFGDSDRRVVIEAVGFEAPMDEREHDGPVVAPSVVRSTTHVLAQAHQVNIGDGGDGHRPVVQPLRCRLVAS